MRFRQFYLCSVMLFTFFYTCLIPGSAVAIEVGGVRLDDVTRVANQDLTLNGAGVRTRWGNRVTLSALYLPEKKNRAADILASQDPKRIAITALRDIPTDKLARWFLEGIQRNLSFGERTKLIVQLQKLGEVFAKTADMQKGDVLTIDWVPTKGTIFEVNGKIISEPFPDIALFNAILKIYIGDKPVDAALKSQLLGET